MNLFGIGPLEFLFIFVIAVIVLGPKGMVDGARQAGKFIRKIIHSPIWRDVVDTSREIREFPRKIAREAGIEKDLDDLRRSTQGTLNEIGNSHIPTIREINEQTQKKSPQNNQKNDEKENG